jgi:hypothetical protein
VEDFRAMRQGRNWESFTVAGQKFSYSDFDLEPGFNTSRARGGPIDEGVVVRITHRHGKILRLEVEPAVAEAMASLPRRSPWPTAEDFPKDSPVLLVNRYSWIVTLAIVLGYAAAWRWQGRPHVARDPSLRAGYKRLTLGLALWAGIPILLSGLIQLSHSGSDFALPGYPSLSLSWTALSNLIWSVVMLKWLYWTFYQDGAGKVVRHPGLLAKEWVLKIWTVFIAGGFLLDVLVDWILHS